MMNGGSGRSSLGSESPLISISEPNHMRDTINGQRATIAKLFEQVGLHKILSLLESEDVDVRVHAVKMVAKSNPPPGGGGHEVVTESAMKRAQKPKEPGASSDAEQHKKKRKRIKEAATNSAQVIEDLGAASGSELHMKRRKKKKKHDEPTFTGLVSNFQSGEGFDADTGPNMSLKKMEKKKKSITTSMENVAQVARDSGFGSDGESHKKKKATEFTPTPGTMNSMQIVEDLELVNGAEAQSKKKTRKEVTLKPSTSNPEPIAEDQDLVSDVELWSKKKKKPTTLLPQLNPSQIVDNSRPITGSAIKTILRKQPVEVGHVLEPHRKKKITF